MINHQNALEAMGTFVAKNISGLVYMGYPNDCAYFRYKNSSSKTADFALYLLENPIKPANSFLREIRDNAKDNIATAVLMLRSTLQYDGDLLRQMPDDFDGTKTWYNKKRLTKFEQDILALYGNSAAYFNPQEDAIQVISTRKFRELPEFLATKNPEQLAANKNIRQTLHREESLINSDRVIWFTDVIKGPFTLERYERSNMPLVARIVSYKC